MQERKTFTEQIAALKSSPAPLQAAQQKTAELEEDKAKFHIHISSLEVCSYALWSAELHGWQHATEPGLCCRQGKLQKLQQRLQEQNIDLQSQQQQVSSTEQVGRPVCLCL